MGWEALRQTTCKIDRHSEKMKNHPKMKLYKKKYNLINLEIFDEKIINSGKIKI